MEGSDRVRLRANTKFSELLSEKYENVSIKKQQNWMTMSSMNNFENAEILPEGMEQDKVFYASIVPVRMSIKLWYKF